MSSFTINKAGVRRLLYSPLGDVYEHFDRIGEKTHVLAVFSAPNSAYSTGTMRNSLEHKTRVRGATIIASAGILKPAVEPYRWYDSGKTRRPQVAELLLMKRKFRSPSVGYPLRFGTPGGGRGNLSKVLYRPVTSPAKPTDFLVDSFKRACPYPVVVTR